MPCTFLIALDPHRPVVPNIKLSHWGTPSRDRGLHWTAQGEPAILNYNRQDVWNSARPVEADQGFEAYFHLQVASFQLYDHPL
jgi:hypothetical protein